MRSVFDSSYPRLTYEEAHVLRMPAVAPGPDLSTEGLTALLGEDSPPFRVLAGLERAYLVGAVLRAAETEHAPVAIRLALALTAYLSRREFVGDWIRVSECAALAARHVGDVKAEAVALGELGGALERDERQAEAVDAALRAQQLLQGTGHREAEAAAWDGLALALAEAGRVEEAIAAHAATRVICRDLGDWYGVGVVPSHLGGLYPGIGSESKARAAWQEALHACDRADAPHEARQIREWLRERRDAR
ncbi:hypothetical protein [Streptomyces sp. NPDC093094]|uniref:hypothetical protein n=1 Tax=Streptomyces sp. NPDC093094 TaxID=3366026 RepID=UPI0037F73770